MDPRYVSQGGGTNVRYRTGLKGRLVSEFKQLRENLAHMAAISARHPEMTIVVAHDPRSFASIPTLVARP
ncbi:hypothetical protein [Archangium violaceum]|uniref:hypothetical protein n=1 Tax=Archangium violaceum TaxID=83451 RepID=UPI001EF5218F|nr:hypothetical protein [Archangium violaceum]